MLISTEHILTPNLMQSFSISLILMAPQEKDIIFLSLLIKRCYHSYTDDYLTSEHRTLL